MFSPTDERPKKPVPMVMVGARNVSNPAAPVEQPTLIAMRSTFISAAKRRMIAGSPAWIAAEWPAPAVPHHGAAGGERRLARRRLEEAEHRAELLAAHRVVVADPLERHEQDARAARHADAGAFGDLLRRLAEQRDVELARREEMLRRAGRAPPPRACGSPAASSPRRAAWRSRRGRSPPTRWCRGSNCRTPWSRRSPSPPWPRPRSRRHRPGCCRGRRRSPDCRRNRRRAPSASRRWRGSGRCGPSSSPSR